MKNSTTAVVLAIIIGSIVCFGAGICLSCGAFPLLTMSFDDFSGENNAADDVRGAAPETGEMASDFYLENLNGDWVSLSDFRGRPVLVNFWATWCSPCIEEMPVIESRFQEHYPELVVLAIESDSSQSELRDFIQDEGITFTILIGSDSVERDYQIYAYPTSYFIDTDGVIRSVVVGSMTEDTLDAELAKIGIGD